MADIPYANKPRYLSDIVPGLQQPENPTIKVEGVKPVLSTVTSQQAPQPVSIPVLSEEPTGKTPDQKKVSSLLYGDDNKMVADTNPEDSLITPVTYQQTAAQSQGHTSVFLGGQVAAPYQLVNKYANIAIDKRKNADQTMWANFKQLEGKPAWQDNLNDYYTNNIFQGVNDLKSEYGEEKATMMLNDPSSPERQDLMNKYTKYSALVTASKQMDEAFKDIQTQLGAGKVLPASVMELYNQYSQGFPGMSEEDAFAKLVALPGQLMTYTTLTDAAAGSVIKDKISKEVQDVMFNGLDVTNPDGTITHLTENDGDKFFEEVTKNFNTQKTIDDVTEMIQYDDKLNPDYKLNTNYIKQYVTDMIPDMVQEQLHIANSTKGTTINNYQGEGNKPVQYPITNETAQISTTGSVNGTETPMTLTSLSGVTLPETDQSTVDLNNDMIKNNNVKSLWPNQNLGAGTTKGKLIGVYAFPINKNGSPVTKGSPSAQPDKDGKIQYNYFARVYVPNPTSVKTSALDPNGQQKDDGTGTYILVPYDEAIQQQSKFVVMPTNPTVSNDYVYKKDTYADKTKSEIPQQQVPPAPKKNTTTTPKTTSKPQVIKHPK